MNLAKVEYYFADFLSVLESRYVDQNGELKQEMLRLHDLPRCVLAQGELAWNVDADWMWKGAVRCARYTARDALCAVASMNSIGCQTEELPTTTLKPDKPVSTRKLCPATSGGASQYLFHWYGQRGRDYLYVQSQSTG
jgi:hypothetical protein